MQVSKSDIYVDIEDELLAVEIALANWEERWEGAKWMFLPREWAIYVQGKVALKRRLRKLKEKLGYDTSS